jgi:hypothetical protein
MFGGRVQFTRDNKTTAAANSVFREMSEIISKFDPPIEKQSVDNFGALPLISVEQAIKELLEMENEINKKES